MANDDREALRWLLKFARMDLDALTPGQLLDARLDASNFTQRPSRGQQGYSFRVSTPVSIDPSDETNGIDDPRIRSFPVRALRDAHERLRSGLYTLIGGGKWALPATSGVTLSLLPGWALPLRHDAVLKEYGAEAIEDRFIQRAADAVEAGWADVRICAREGCANRFIPVRRQIHCSVECMRRSKWQRYKTQHPKRKRDYHAEYAKRIKRQLGPGARPQRRSKKGR